MSTSTQQKFTGSSDNIPNGTKIQLHEYLTTSPSKTQPPPPVIQTQGNSLSSKVSSKWTTKTPHVCNKCDAVWWFYNLQAYCTVNYTGSYLLSATSSFQGRGKNSVLNTTKNVQALIHKEFKLPRLPHGPNWRQPYLWKWTNCFTRSENCECQTFLHDCPVWEPGLRCLGLWTRPHYDLRWGENNQECSLPPNPDTLVLHGRLQSGGMPWNIISVARAQRPTSFQSSRWENLDNLAISAILCSSNDDWMQDRRVWMHQSIPRLCRCFVCASAAVTSCTSVTTTLTWCSRYDKLCIPCYLGIEARSCGNSHNYNYSF